MQINYNKLNIAFEKGNIYNNFIVKTLIGNLQPQKTLCQFKWAK